MNDFFMILTTLIGGAPIAYVIGLVIGRKKRKAENSDALVESINKLSELYRTMLVRYEDVNEKNIILTNENLKLHTIIAAKENLIAQLKLKVEKLSKQITKLSTEVNGLKSQLSQKEDKKKGEKR